MKENIVFYIHKTGLLSYFVDPICSYLSQKYRITVFHLNKKNHFQYTPKNRELYDFVDLSGVSIRETRKRLKELKPVAVLLPGFVSIYELLMLRLPIDLGIKTVYIEHGIFSNQTSHLSVPINRSLKMMAFSFSKNLFYLWRYFIFILSSKHPFQEVSIFVNCLFKRKYYLSKFDKALFFAPYGYRKVNELFHYDNKDVLYMGYPLTSSNTEFLQLQVLVNESIINKKEAVYIHQPFIMDGLASWSYDEEALYLEKVSASLKKYGYSLSLAIHPRENVDEYRKRLSGKGIAICSALKAIDYRRYSLCIGHYSTALLIPIFMRIPITILDYPGVFESIGSLFSQLSCDLESIDKEKNINKYDSFIKDVLGDAPMSFENIAERIVIAVNN